ncbi:helix-turn-helix domain-containing protein [Saccharopolyspora spinosporotrichia]|uniref:Helix-turn-helix domain-containing protein n=1 Tax=Saccharopolyspora erythraea TaxID=1836 RepID=A0ABP3NTH1_SACER|nr:helix-turn-helix domain-containing protein [Saccharopolyspora erythraea]
MVGRTGQGRRPTASDTDTASAWLAAVAEAASRAAGGVPVELLGDYLPLLAEAAATGRRPKRSELKVVDALGHRAAELGISAGSAVELYLSAAWRLWRQLPEVARSDDPEEVRAAAEAVLHVVADSVATLAEGYTQARRQLVRWEETLRRELIDDLLRGDADVGGLVERAEPFGLDLSRTHRVALAAPSGRSTNAEAATSSLEKVMLDWLGDRDVLVATKEGVLVVLAPADADPKATSGAQGTSRLGERMHAELSRLPRGKPWRIAVGRGYAGSYGIARSYEEARDTLTMASTMHLDSPVIYAEELLVYRVLFRDQPAMVDLVRGVLGPLTRARGGAEPLLATLEAFFATGGVVTDTARRLHLSVRAVTYRLDRVKALTGHAPTNPAHRLTLHAAVLGARFFGWPQHELPAR